MAKKAKQHPDTLVQYRRARHDYELLDEYEAGIQLRGSEVKSLRAGEGELRDGFILIRGGEAWLVNAHINPYKFTAVEDQDPTRTRKLLLHQHEIEKVETALTQKGLTAVPLRFYLKDGKIKLAFAVARGKKNYDKRAALRKKADRRDLQEQY